MGMICRRLSKEHNGEKRGRTKVIPPSHAFSTEQRLFQMQTLQVVGDMVMPNADSVNG